MRYAIISLVSTMKIQSITYQKFRWLHFTHPSKEDLDFLAKNFHFHPLDLENCTARLQRPKIDISSGYVYIILHFPQSNHYQRIISCELNAFISNNFLVTVTDAKLPALTDFFEKCRRNKRTRLKFLGRGPGFLFYALSDRLIDSCFPVLNNLVNIIDQIDQKIFDATARDIVQKISNTRRNLVVLQTMIKPAIPIFTQLEKGEVKRLNGNLIAYWSNLADHLSKIWDRLEDYKELIEGLSATNESLLSHRTNEIIKVLTIFSVILMPLTLLSGIYGMNINSLPFAHHPFSLIFIAFIMLVIAGSMFLYFKKKHWL